MASSKIPQPANANEVLERLSQLSLREHTMDSLLQAVAGLSKSVLPGNPETSVLLLVKGRPSTVAQTDQLALDLDKIQYERGQGPCMQAASTIELVEVPDTREETRWDGYGPSAAEKGNLSSLSVPLTIDPDEQVSGALNIYARKAHAFDETSRAVATRFAPYAAVAVGNMHAYQSTRMIADNLAKALDSRAVIDQAKGILMERHKLTADQAFEVLARTSMTTNTKVRAVADHLVRTGELFRA